MAVMTNILRKDALTIFAESVQSVMPDKGVRKALSEWEVPERIILAGIGKASWVMSKAASDILGKHIKRGVVITKYGHSIGPIKDIEIFEGGHPLPDENGLAGTKRILEITKNLNFNDCVLFLVSGGGSALFEAPVNGCSLPFIEEINRKLLSGGADIYEINTVRKRLSSVKGGRFAIHCLPARIYQIVLSDVIGNRLDIIASGPAAADTSTSTEALHILQKYDISIPAKMKLIFESPAPKSLNNVDTSIIGSVKDLCRSAASEAEKLGYKATILTEELNGEARKTGEYLAKLAHKIKNGKSGYIAPCAIIMGGETVVHVRGTGKGGRNQEVALAAAEGIAGLENVVILSAGSDGTDGPTDAAGGIVDESTWTRLKQDIDATASLDNNDSYYALKACGGLIKTGPTGTNVNDLILLLCG